MPIRVPRSAFLSSLRKQLPVASAPEPQPPPANAELAAEGDVPRAPGLGRIEIMRYPVTDHMPLKHKVWMTFDDPTFSAFATRWAQFSILLIFSSSITFCLETEINCTRKIDWSAIDPDAANQTAAELAVTDYGHSFVTAENCEAWELAWWGYEFFAVMCFTFELLLRTATAPSQKRFWRNGFNIIDITAVAPFYIEKLFILAGLGKDGAVLGFLGVCRVMRLARIFRLFKMGTSANGMQLVSATAGAALRESLALLIGLVFITLILMVLFSSILYTIEDGDKTLNQETHDRSDPLVWFVSITRTFWWSLVTITGVGYGDEYPMGLFGRILAIICMCVGVVIVALPIEVIGRYFLTHFERHEFSTWIEVEFEDEGRLDLKRLYKMLGELDRRGNLLVPLPADEAACRKMISAYDGKGNLMLEHEEWSALIEDVVADKADFDDGTVRKIARDLGRLRTELAACDDALRQLASRKEAQAAELARLLRERAGSGGGGGGTQPRAPPALLVPPREGSPLREIADGLQRGVETIRRKSIDAMRDLRELQESARGHGHDAAGAGADRAGGDGRERREPSSSPAEALQKL